MRDCTYLRLAILLAIFSLLLSASAQTEIRSSIHITQVLPDTTNYSTNGVNDEYFRLIIPDNYNPLTPPALLIGGHGLGATYDDFPQPFLDTASAWGWLSVAIDGSPARTDGTGYTHWFSHRVLNNLDRVLDTIATMYPFDPDSIYFVGSSMGAAAGIQYHHYHLDPNGYMLAGTASGSGILDLLRRVREQIRYDNYTMNTSMHIEFGPADTVPAACVNYRYKFNSAMVLWDTTNSRHYNISWLPVYFAAGIQEHHDTAATDLISLYGSFMRAETMSTEPGVQHGWPNLNADTVMHWLRHWGKTYRHPTFQNVSCDSARRCYDIEFVTQRVDTCVCRAFAYFDSALVGNTWYLTHPRLTLMRNASAVKLHRQLPPDEPFDSLQVTNADNSEVALSVFYQNLSNASILVTSDHPEIPQSVSYADGGALWTISSIPSGMTIHGRISVTYAARDRNALPEGYSMSVYPNPFNGMATIRFVMPRGSATDLTLYDVTGRMVKAFPRKFARSQSAVYFSLPSEGLASGSYFLLGKSGNTTLRQRITLLK